MRLLSRMPLPFALLALALTGPAVGSASAHGRSDVVGHVYVNDNTAGSNTIGAFDRHADGSLTPEAGSPFPAGGAGTGAGLASQGALQISSDGRFLVAVDAGSNQISVLRIKHDGSLRLVRDGVVSSGGVLPVSVAIHDELVYVANAGSGGSNYTGFRLSDHGRLEPLAGSTVALPDSAQPGDVLFNGNGRKLVGTRVGTSQIDSFTVGRDGRLTRGAGLAVPRAGARSVRQRVPSDEPGSAVRLQRPQRRRRQRHGLRVQRCRRRHVVSDRSLAVRRSPDRRVLGRDHRRWPVPVHRQHRVGFDLPLRDRPGWRTDAAWEHRGPSHRWCRCGGRPPEPRRPHAVRGREPNRQRRRVQSQRRQPDRARELSDLAPGRRQAGRHRRQLALAPGFTTVVRATSWGPLCPQLLAARAITASLA